MYAFDLIAAALLLVSAVGCSSQDLVAKRWLWDITSGSGFNPTLENEVHSFWPVTAEKIDEAIKALKGGRATSISPDDAQRLIAVAPTVEPGRSLFLIRGIDVYERPIPMRVFESKGVVMVEAGTYSTCFFIKPGTKAQPLVAALPQSPSRVVVGYSCDGP